MPYFLNTQQVLDRTSSCIINWMSIQELPPKFKGILRSTEFHLSLLIIGVSLASFVLGRLSVTEKSYVIEQKAQIVDTQPLPPEATTKLKNSISNPDTVKEAPQSENAYVASKSGTKYHLPWCGGAKRIKEENKIWFATKEEAEKAGYTPAANCKGI